MKIRQEKEVPIIDELFQAVKNKLVDGKHLPKSNFYEFRFSGDVAELNVDEDVAIITTLF